MRKRNPLRPRKEPQQERSRQMREDILAASVRVLRKEGALRFTTPRVAAAAGISVGSLYQYFPNKHALLFAQHLRIMESSWADVQRILDKCGDGKRASPRGKLRQVARLFFLTESQDAASMGALLPEIESRFAEQPEYRALIDQAHQRLTRFVRESALRPISAQRARFGAQLLITVLESVGKSVAALRLPQAEVARWARATADMLADHLELASARRAPAARRAVSSASP